MTCGRRSVLWSAWIAAAVVTRLPQLLAPDLTPDADEAVLGLMARQVAAGERLHVFFAGQSYGFSLLEVGSAALLFHLFGVSTVALKVSMMLIWMAGGALLIAAVDRVVGRRAAWLSLILLAACPAWSEWSLKARGGYLTAFALSGLVIYLYGRLRADRNRHPILTGVLGAAVALVPFAQAVWAPVTLSFLALLFCERRRVHDLAGFAAGAGGVVILLVLAVMFEPDSVWRPGFTAPADVPGELASLPRDVVINLSGVYLLETNLSTCPGTRLAGVLWSVALVCVIIRAAYRATSGDALARATLLSLSGALAIYPLVSSGQHPYRYLLPVSQVVIVYLAVTLGHRGRFAAWPLGILTLCGVVAVLETPRCFVGASRSPTGVRLATALDHLADRLLSRGVHHAYAVDGLCQYTLPFQTDERIRARGWSNRDRLPENARAVDRALREGTKTALIGPIAVMSLLADRLKQVGVALPDDVEAVAGTFIVAYDPTPETLRACLFVLHDEP